MLLQGWQSAGKNLDPGSEIFIFLADLEISFWRNLPFASKLSLPNAGQLDASSCPKEARFPRLLRTGAQEEPARPGSLLAASYPQEPAGAASAHHQGHQVRG